MVYNHRPVQYCLKIAGERLYINLADGGNTFAKIKKNKFFIISINNVIRYQWDQVIKARSEVIEIVLNLITLLKY